MPAMPTRGGNKGSRRRRFGGVGALLIVLGTPLGLTSMGCTQPLYDAKDDRTQYDRYRRARSDLAPPYIEDEYGRKTPNLRERLNPN